MWRLGVVGVVWGVGCLWVVVGCWSLGVWGFCGGYEVVLVVVVGGWYFF